MKHAELWAERRAALGPDGAQGYRPTYPLDEGLS